MRKKWLSLLAIAVLSLSVAACGGKDAEKTDASSNVEEKDVASVETEEKEEKEPVGNPPSIAIEDIDWKVEDAVIDGEKVISFNYTNNTKYPIAEVEIKFVQKEGLTKEQLAVFDDLKTERNWSDEDVTDIYIKGYNRKLADPGETVTDSPCSINGTFTSAESMAQYEIMQPDMASIVYIGDDNKAYLIYYDFNTKTYGDSTAGGKDIQEWSDSALCTLLPKPEFRILTVDNDDDDKFSFDSYGVSREEYDAYAEKCKEAGFTNVQFESDSSYRALNVDGHELHISYNVIDEEVYGSVEKTEVPVDESSSTENESSEDYEKQIEDEKEAVLKQIEEEKKAFLNDAQ